MKTSTRILAAMTAIWCGCGSDNDGPKIIVADAAVDASADAPPPPPPDAPGPSMEITTACTNVCDRFGVCAGETVPASCVTECAADLADCTPQQVMDVNACAQAECGDQLEGVIACLTAIACVDG